ncbi:CRTAC1 family protein [Maribacter sp. TH_r10]|uniref:CRTAC1 family protein n=1 Tax=Maribacter sp. TH_r10 TaxID=3082086 RepID=UPI0029544C62|nr:CRTAC1 family protein [Maribacter sp. TH_r10]MDV7139051.1 CRTAC1 family protein [Maribacter sp. TH_r10]
MSVIQKNSIKTFSITSLFLILISNHIQGQHAVTDASVHFKETFEDFVRKDKNLRKWDAPSVADLDQDGYPDLLLNDHGLGISVCWNNQGHFAKPIDVIMGDLHGVAVGDIDFDGKLEVIMSRGGGSGSNARNSKMFRVNKKREFIPLEDFDIPLEMMRGRTVKFFDGDNDGDLDLINFAFPTKEKKGKSENYVYENDGNGQLILKSTLPPSIADGQKTLLTDINSDNIIDLILYGHETIKVFQGLGDLTFKEVTGKVLPNPISDVTSVVEIDYDNDGDFDLYLTRGKDFEIGETFYNKQTKNWAFYTKRGNFKFEDLQTGDVLQMRNFQSQWPYNDAYYIGETGYLYDFPGETHSGKDIRLVNSNALGFPDKLNEKGGIHVGYVGNDRWRIAGNTWSPTTGVVHGVLDYPEYNHPEGLPDIFLENKNGKFVDITKKAKLILEEHTVAASVADLDNNGFQDLLVIRRGNMVFQNEPIVYLNQGNSQFQQEMVSGISTSDWGSMGMAVEVLDYDLDGKVDIVIGNERGKWHLFKNLSKEANTNSFISIEVGTSSSGQATSLGAIVNIKSCTGVQTQHIGSTGASYSQSFNKLVHFGLGQCNKPIKVTVTWSNGEAITRTINKTRQKITIGKN